MRVLAIIVTYYPKIDDLTNNILQFIDCIDKLIIWQNTPLIDRDNYIIEDFKSNEKVIYMGNNENMGIAYALNRAFDMMMNDSNEFTHLITMDQDSTWVNFSDYTNYLKKMPNNSIYSPYINNESKSSELLRVKTCITSGATFSKEILLKIGKFNETYSVDCVDYDFCFRAARKGYSIYKVPGCYMNQVYGTPLESSFLHLKTNSYSAWRYFFIVRNHILLWKDYPDQMDFNFKRMILSSYVFGKILKVILMENQKISKINAILKGFTKGLLDIRTDKY